MPPWFTEGFRALDGIPAYPRQLTYAHTSHLFNAPSAAHYDSPIAAGISPPPALCKLALCLYFRFYGLPGTFCSFMGPILSAERPASTHLFENFVKVFFITLRFTRFSGILPAAESTAPNKERPGRVFHNIAVFYQMARFWRYIWRRLPKQDLPGGRPGSRRKGLKR